MQRLRLLAVLALALCIALVGLQRRPDAGGIPVTFTNSSFAVSAPQQVAAVADVVLVARVGRTTATTTVAGIPATRHQVQVLEVLKGQPTTSLEVTQLGGLDAASHQLVLVDGDSQLPQGSIALLALVNHGGTLLVVPVGGTRVLPAARATDAPWAGYPAVAAMRSALAALPATSGAPRQHTSPTAMTQEP